MANQNLQAAKAAKKDEFYTQLSDIEKELRHYKEHFRDKVVYCNCDDPLVSNFVVYFIRNFEHLGLKRLIATCYRHKELDLFGAATVCGAEGGSEEAVYMIYEGDKNHNNALDPEELEVHPLKGDGDFRSAECIELLEQADIVCTNPPFSLFREYVAQLMKYEKKFLIIGNVGAASYKEIFPLIMHNQMWLGFHSGHTLFSVPESYDIPDYYDKNDKQKLSSNGYKIDESGKLWRNLGNICWFTNLDHTKRHEPIILYKSYSPNEYPTYENLDAIDIAKIPEIPGDYFGLMGAPITFFDKYCPEQFEILGLLHGNLGVEAGIKPYDRSLKILNKGLRDGDPYYMKDGVPVIPYSRILIRRKQ